MNRRNGIIIAGVCVVLLAVITTLWVLDTDGRDARRELLKNAGIDAYCGNTSQLFSVALLDEIGQTDITATRDTSKAGPVEQTFTGVPLAAVIEKLDKLATSGFTTVVATAADGYSVAYSAADALDADNIWLVTAMNGEPLGDKDSGGDGPFMLIVRKDAFSTRWCKYLVRLEFK